MIPKVGLIQYNPFPEYSIPQCSSPGFMIESIHVWLPHWLYNQGEGIAKIWGLDWMMKSEAIYPGHRRDFGAG